jgi:xanthine dehydrogenase accessory factor
MEEIYPQLEALGRSERRVAMATLVGTKGTTPKKEGAKMWVGEGGRVLGSVTIGGCIDARVIEESEGVLHSGAPRRLKMALGDEDAWEIGLSCGGTVEVLVERLELGGDAPVLALYRRIAAEVDQSRGACLVRLLREPDRALLVLANGDCEGSLGDEALDRAARSQSAALLLRGTSRTDRLGTNDPAATSGEGPEAFFEVHSPRPHLVLIGAGHVSMPLTELAKTLGYRITVVDARPRFATRERFPGADELRIGIPSEIIEQIPLVASTAVVLTVHDYKVEVPVLRAVLKSGVGYVGMLGNRHRGRGVLEVLRKEGVAEAQLARVHVPVGLDIGAQTAAEIATSVLAEVIAVRSGKSGSSLAEAAKADRAPGSPAASRRGEQAPG